MDVPAIIEFQHPRAYAGFDPTQARAADGTWAADDEGDEKERAVTVEDADQPIVKLHLRMLALVPKGLRTRLENEGVTWWISAKSVGEMLPELEGTPRGWDPGSSWNDVAGAFVPDTREILAGRGKEGSASVLLHETGHAVAIVFKLNNAPALLALQKIKRPGGGSYYKGAAGREELLAESFAVRLKLGQYEAQRQYGKKYVAWLDKKLGLKPDPPVVQLEAFSHPRAFYDPRQRRDRRGRWTDSGVGVLDLDPAAVPAELGEGQARRLVEEQNHDAELGKWGSSTASVLKARNAQEIAAILRGDPDFQAARDALLDEQWTWDLRGDDVTEQVVDLLQRQWAATSRDGDPLSHLLQEETAAEFGLSLPNFVGRDGLEKAIRARWGGFAQVGPSDQEDIVQGALAKYDRLGSPAVRRGLRKFVRAQYRRTQTFLEQDGIEELFLYRGVSWTDVADKPLRPAGFEPGKRVGGTSLQPASSFATTFRVAAVFSGWPDGEGAIMATTVPRDRILAIPNTGWGAWREDEVVVLGGDAETFVWSWDRSFAGSWSSDGTKSPEGVRAFLEGYYAQGGAASPAEEPHWRAAKDTLESVSVGDGGIAAGHPDPLDTYMTGR